ncbi:hypothetical protein [Planktotalea sp.]|uniref:hypothetical protein n=1 Tax=Planktotalea sp. TaxID=2029877 RepID=UPI0025E9D1B7|nr:hypothetical protein [Planktotalea sp.]
MWGRCDGAFEAFAAIFEIMVENGILIGPPLIFGTLVIGSITSGVIAEMTDKRGL